MAFDSFRAGGLRIPDELVYFASPEVDAALILNPELGSYTSVRGQDVRQLQAYLRNTSGPDEDMLKSADDDVSALLRKLILKRVIYYGAFEPKIDERMPAAPPAVYWETTNGCSLRCKYCYMSADTVRPGELTTVEARELIDQCADLGVKRFVFTGGEPLIRRDIFELAHHAKNRGLSTEIITNATLITSREMALKVKEAFGSVITSLDGSCPEANDVHRGSGSFEQIVFGILQLNAVGVRPAINSAVSEANVAYVEQLLEFVKEELAVAQHRVINIGFLGRGSGSDLDYSWQTYKETFRAIQESNRLSRERASLTVDNHVNFVSKKSTLKPRKNCGMGSGEFYVDSQGEVYPCKLVTTESWRCGNVKRSPLSQLLLEAPMLKAKDLTVMERRGCRTCIIRRLCGGGCRGFHMGKSGDAEVNDPQFCWVLRHQMLNNLWHFENLPEATYGSTAFVPRKLSTDEVWQPEIGTALPKHELEVLSHLQQLERGSESLSLL